MREVNANMSKQDVIEIEGEVVEALRNDAADESPSTSLRTECRPIRFRIVCPRFDST